MVLLLLGFTIWKILYCYLVTFPCTFMFIYITVFSDLWHIFFMYNSVINCAALLSMVMNLRCSVNCGMGGEGRSLLKRLLITMLNKIHCSLNTNLKQASK